VSSCREGIPEHLPKRKRKNHSSETNRKPSKNSSSRHVAVTDVQAREWLDHSDQNFKHRKGSRRSSLQWQQKSRILPSVGNEDKLPTPKAQYLRFGGSNSLFSPRTSLYNISLKHPSFPSSRLPNHLKSELKFPFSFPRSTGSALPLGSNEDDELENEERVISTSLETDCFQDVSAGVVVPTFLKQPLTKNRQTYEGSNFFSPTSLHSASWSMQKPMSLPPPGPRNSDYSRFSNTDGRMDVSPLPQNFRAEITETRSRDAKLNSFADFINKLLPLHGHT
jgi:hypothetical protein